MSIENAKTFMAKVGQDAALKAKLVACKSPNERFTVAKDRGYEFTTAEFNEAKTELTDGELDLVAGGSCCGYTCEEDTNCDDRFIKCPENQQQT